MRVTSRADYALRAVVELARGDASPVKGEAIAQAVDAPAKYLEGILGELRVAGIVRSQRGSAGGYRLARPAELISAAEVIRATEGPLAAVRGEPPEELEYPESLIVLQQMWVAVRAAVRQVLEGVSVADLARGTLPGPISRAVGDPQSWESTIQRQGRRAGVTLGK